MVLNINESESEVDKKRNTAKINAIASLRLMLKVLDPDTLGPVDPLGRANHHLFAK